MSDTKIDPAKREVAIIRVKSDSGTHGLAHTIFAAVKKNKIIVVQAVGAGAVNNSCKGIATAGQMLAREGIALVCKISFQDGEPSSGHTEPVSMIVIHVHVEELK